MPATAPSATYLRALNALLGLGTLALALPPRGPRPAPAADTVRTPEGPRPRALAHRVEVGDAVRQLPDGTFARVDPLTGEILAHATLALPPAARRPLAGDWITYTYWSNRTGTPVTTFTTRWVVPPPPASRDGQTVFLFNGIQNNGRNFGILQPVLQWGESAAGGGDYWSIASWYVTINGEAFYTPLVRVHPGDDLVGTITMLSRDGKNFTYTSEFEGRESTRLRVENIAELTWTNEALEAYYILRCSDYPEAPDVPLTNIRMLTQAHPPLRWTPVDRITNCGQHADVVSHSASDGRVDLWLTARRADHPAGVHPAE